MFSNHEITRKYERRRKVLPYCGKLTGNNYFFAKTKLHFINISASPSPQQNVELLLLKTNRLFENETFI